MIYRRAPIHSIVIVLALLCLLVFPETVRGVSVDIDFNKGTELASLFTVITVPPSAGGPVHLTQVPTGGVSNSGAVAVDAVNAGAAATYHVSPFNFPAGAPLSASIFFQFHDFTLPPGNSRNTAVVGFVNEPDGTFSPPNNDDMSVEVQSSDTGENFLFSNFGRRGTGLASSLSLVDGNWYRLSGRFVNLGSTLEICASLDDFGPTGDISGRPVSSSCFSRIPDGDILSDNSIWLAFGANSLGGVSLVDNLAGVEPVPEPAPAAFLASVLLGLACLRLGLVGRPRLLLLLGLVQRSRTRSSRCSL